MNNLNIRLVFLEAARRQPELGTFALGEDGSMGVLLGDEGFVPFDKLRFSSSPPGFFDARKLPDAQFVPMQNAALVELEQVEQTGGATCYALVSVAGQVIPLGEKELLLEAYFAIGRKLIDMLLSNEWVWAERIPEDGSDQGAFA